MGRRWSCGGRVVAFWGVCAVRRNAYHCSATPSQTSAPRSQQDGEDGAALAEFAIIVPLLIMLLVGTVEFGWLAAQYLDVRHGAREGVRLATVNFPEGEDPPILVRTQANTTALLDETCSRMNITSDAAITYASAGDPGDSVAVTATAPAQTLSGLVDWALPSTLTLTSTAVLHAEQTATWENTDIAMFPDGQPCP